MIVESLVDLFINIILNALSAFEVIGLPYQLINTLSTITVYGVWIVGIDVMSIVFTCIVFWWTTKFAVGLIVWLWELVPLT